jgi:hypothetical protein
MLTKASLTLIAALVLASASTAFADPSAQNCNVKYKGFSLCDWYDSYLH